MLGTGDTGMEVDGNSVEAVMQPRDWQPQVAVATPWLETQREDKWHQDPGGRDAGRTWEPPRAFGATDPEETLPVLRAPV